MARGEHAGTATRPARYREGGRNRTAAERLHLPSGVTSAPVAPTRAGRMESPPPQRQGAGIKERSIEAAGAIAEQRIASNSKLQRNLGWRRLPLRRARWRE